MLKILRFSIIIIIIIAFKNICIRIQIPYPNITKNYMCIVTRVISHKANSAESGAIILHLCHTMSIYVQK